MEVLEQTFEDAPYLRGYSEGRERAEDFISQLDIHAVPVAALVNEFEHIYDDMQRESGNVNGKLDFLKGRLVGTCDVLVQQLRRDLPTIQASRLPTLPGTH